MMKVPLSSLDLPLMRAFVAVAREGNVSRAAQRLHLSQPAVSLQLKRLSEAVGLPLFVRSTQGLELTPEGARLQAHAEQVLEAIGDFARQAEQLHGAVRGVLRVGTVLDPEFTRLGAFLRHFAGIAPQVQTELQQGMSGDVLARLQQHELDVGYCLDAAMPAQDDPAAGLFGVRDLLAFHYKVVAPAGWGPRVHGKGWEGLLALPWIATPTHSAHHHLLAPVLAAFRRQPVRAALVDQEASMLDLLKSGVGLSLVRDATAIRESQTHGLVIADQVQLPCTLRFVWLKARTSEPVVECALQALARAWA